MIAGEKGCSGPTLQKPSQVRSFTADKVNSLLCSLM